ncbi:MAG: DUF1549 domain-containing protein [Planctomycetota bacterium]|mgnify:CR=1 FL=1
MRPLLLLWCVVAFAYPANAEKQAELVTAAAEIDTLIDQALAAQGVQAQPICDDAAIVRRAWMDLGGRIPTASEAKTFLGDHRTDKRAQLVTLLIGSPAWDMATFEWLADILRVESRIQDRVPGHVWIDWLKRCIQTNRPWDVMCRDMVTATGAMFVDGGGATGFSMRDTGMPLEHAALMAQTFLGTRIGCAQCHDHPYDRWSRLDFLRFAAFSADARTDLVPTGAGAIHKKMVNEPPEVKNLVRAIGVIAGARITPAHKDWLPVPTDYQYDNAKVGERISAQSLFAPIALTRKTADPRATLATWLTSPANPRFSLAIGNRVWKRLFGWGLIEPVDDIRGEPDQALPPLQARLAKLVVDCAFDLRRVSLALALTRHWQRQVWTGDPPAAGGVVPGRPAQRISAHVWWDSLVTLAVEEPEASATNEADMLYKAHDQLSATKGEGLVDLAKKLLELRKGGAEALAAADPETVTVAHVMRMTGRNAAKGKKLTREPLRRAAEMPQPAPGGHPLRVLGQSDRQLIDNSSTQPTTVQALLLMNGVIDSEVLLPRSRLMRELAELKDGAAQLEHLWLAVLSRHPTAAERDRVMPEMRTRAGISDVAWALLNGSEFRMTP